MNMNDRDYELLLDYLHGQLAEERLPELYARLKQEPTLASQLQLLSQHEAALADWSQTRQARDSADRQDVQPAGNDPWWLRSGQTIYDFASNYWALSLLVSGLAMTIMVLSMALIVPDWKQFVPSNEVEEPSVEFVAHITKFEMTTWDKTSDGNLMNRDLFIGDKLILKEGLVEITYDTGACVVLEGPATYGIAGSDSGNLQQGKLSARIEGMPATDFSVSTPGARVIDRGTEFGVEVDADGAAEVVVVTGAVEVVRESVNGVVSKEIRLTANQGAYLPANGRAIVRRDVVDPDVVGVIRQRFRLHDATKAIDANQVNAIGLNFVDGRNSRDCAMLPNASAGVVAQSNWNNTDANTENDGLVEGTVVNVAGPLPGKIVDSRGQATDAQVTWTGFTTWVTISDRNQFSQDKLLTGFLLTEASEGPPTSVTFDEIPYESYDVYVYFVGQGGASGSTGTVSLNGDVERRVTSLDFDDIRLVEASGEGEGGNFVRFANVGGRTMSVSLVAHGDLRHMGISGVQVVEVENPVAESSER